jgi:hypothetical protein
MLFLCCLVWLDNGVNAPKTMHKAINIGDNETNNGIPVLAEFDIRSAK